MLLTDHELEKMLAREFTFRPNTQDVQTVAEVLLQNEYGLPEELEASDVVIDVGANIGCFAVDALRRGAGKVLCYEPDPDNFPLLRRNVAPYDLPYGRVEVYQEAVAGAAGKARLYRRLGLTAMSFLHEEGDQEVTAVTLDDVLRPFRRVRLLKLDCEGAEWQALAHSGLLGRCQEVAAELHCAGPHDPRIAEVVARLGKAGFEVTAAPQARHQSNWMLRAVNVEKGWA